eukprot:scaffold13842_cov115-Isochrysis_galbana.AAC.14
MSDARAAVTGGRATVVGRGRPGWELVLGAGARRAELPHDAGIPACLVTNRAWRCGMQSPQDPTVQGGASGGGGERTREVRSRAAAAKACGAVGRQPIGPYADAGLRRERRLPHRPVARPQGHCPVKASTRAARVAGRPADLFLLAARRPARRPAGWVAPGHGRGTRRTGQAAPAGPRIAGPRIGGRRVAGRLRAHITGGRDAPRPHRLLGGILDGRPASIGGLLVQVDLQVALLRRIARGGMLKVELTDDFATRRPYRRLAERHSARPAVLTPAADETFLNGKYRRRGGTTVQS